MVVKIDAKFDIQKLRQYLEFVKAYSAPVMKGVWGGWSITSSNGEVTDGWTAGWRLFANEADHTQKNQIVEVFQKKHDVPTALYTELIAEIVAKLAEKGIQVTRIRLAVLTPHREEHGFWHKDGVEVPNYLKLRLHIPIVTNSQCYFEYQDSRFHMPADGSAWLVNVGKDHRVLNLSSEDRYHLIMDVLSSQPA